MSTARPDRPGIPGSPSLEEKIRLRAYELYLQRGGNEGSEFDDWLQAEAEIRQSAIHTPAVRLVPTGKMRPRKMQA
jgi:hypothetical protein